MSESSSPEPFLPKVSLRLLIGVVTISAALMGIVQQAVTTGAMWAVLSTVCIATVLLPVVFYVGTFSLASLFSTIGAAAMGPEKPQVIYTPTSEMPPRESDQAAARKAASASTTDDDANEPDSADG